MTKKREKEEERKRERESGTNRDIPQKKRNVGKNYSLFTRKGESLRNKVCRNDDLFVEIVTNVESKGGK